MTGPEPFEVDLAAPARRALQRLPEKVATAAIEFIYGALAANPARVGRPLRFDLEGLHSAHRGDYRVVYEVLDEVLLIQVVRIGHRRKVYR